MYRLVYKSSCQGELSRDMVRSILRESSELNAEAGVTGALLATDSNFLQVLEGDFKAVNGTFMRIVKDPRHSEVLIISFGPVESRLFQGWAMMGLGVFDLNSEMEQELKRKYGSDQGSVLFPTEEWAALSLINDVHMMSGSMR